VWGFLTDVSSRVGAAAEYITVKVSTVSLAPGKAVLAEAAALTSVGVAALHALRDVLRLAPGDNLLIVGRVVVRAAPPFSWVSPWVPVTAVAGTANHTFCRDLGASRTVWPLVVVVVHKLGERDAAFVSGRVVAHVRPLAGECPVIALYFPVRAWGVGPGPLVRSTGRGERVGPGRGPVARPVVGEVTADRGDAVGGDEGSGAVPEGDRGDGLSSSRASVQASRSPWPCIRHPPPSGMRPSFLMSTWIRSPMRSCS